MMQSEAVEKARLGVLVGEVLSFFGPSGPGTVTMSAQAADKVRVLCAQALAVAEALKERSSYPCPLQDPVCPRDQEASPGTFRGLTSEQLFGSDPWKSESE